MTFEFLVSRGQCKRSAKRRDEKLATARLKFANLHIGGKLQGVYGSKKMRVR